MEPAELFAQLDSGSDEARKKLLQMLSCTREAWLLNGIFDYYIWTNSARCIEVLVNVREPHDKYLCDRLAEAIKGPQPAKLQALTVLGHVIRKQPGWLYKITQHQLLKDLLKLVRTETEIVPLLSALLAVVVLLPMVPALIGPHLQDIFDIFSRLAAWNWTPGPKLAEEQLVHLQVAMYALFLRLYGMYPCNFIAYLRNHYRHPDNRPVFMHTVRPMLATVLVHPSLVTASKDHETDTERWKKMGHHDVIVECEKFAVDGGVREEGCYTGFRSRSGTGTSGEHQLVGSGDHHLSPFPLPALKLPLSSGDDFWSPSLYFYQHSNSPPPTEVSAPTSIPQTPNSVHAQEGTSPPEAAIEATPETTPIKDPRMNQRVPPINSTAVRSLGGPVTPKWPSLPSGTTTPSSSQPSSPMRKDPSPFKFPQDNFELNARRQNALVSQKITRLIEDRSQVNLKNPTSPLRVINPSMHSPVALLENPAMQWQLAKPTAQPLTPGADSSQEDQEVLEIVRLAELQQHVKPQRLQQCDSVLQEFQPPEEEYDDCEQEHGSPCTSGGLHMPNSHSLQAFATRVKRLRYYSQCAPETHKHENGTSQNIPLPNSIKVRRANSCPEMKKNYPNDPPQRQLALDESDELLDTSTPIPHNLSNGTDEKRLLASIGTQTNEMWPMPYEHLFLGIFPLMEGGEVRPSPAPSPAPIKFTPYDMLDKFIEHAARMGETDPVRYQTPRGGHQTNHLEAEIKTLREQLGLLHLQLQYERHRREVHAVRNRRLLGESRSNKALEEHNSALRDQLTLLQKEIESLHEQLTSKKQDSVMRERELQEIVSYWHTQCLQAQDLNKRLREDADNLQRTLTDLQQIHQATASQYQTAEARLFQVESEMENALAQARDSQRIAADLERMRTELLLAGEINHRFQERLTQLPLIRHRDDEMSLLTAAYHDEIKNLNQQLEQRTSLVESYRAHVSELESRARECDEMCAVQKRMLKEVKEMYDEQLRSVESRYERQKTINRGLEERLLDLWQRIEVLRAAQRRPQHHSPDTSSCHEAMGGGASTTQPLSPHSSPPLSASLASSEGSMRAFLLSGPPSGQPSASQDQIREMKNLQVIVNQGEERSGVNSSEETTPDGTTRSLNSLHSE